MSLLNLCFASAWLVFQFNCHPFWQCGLVFSLPTSIKYNSPFVFFQTHICLWDNAVHHCHEEFLPVKSFSFHIFHTWRLFWTPQIDVMYCHCFLFSLIPPSLSPYLSRACFLCVLTLRHFSCHVFMSFFFLSCHLRIWDKPCSSVPAVISLGFLKLLKKCWSSEFSLICFCFSSYFNFTSLKMRKIHFSVLLLRLPLSKFCVAEHR